MITEKEIKAAAENASSFYNVNSEDFQTDVHFETGFKQGVQWALEQVKQKELSKRCHCGEIEIESHTCPYKEDIYNDSKTLCNCCDYCKTQCKNDI